MGRLLKYSLGALGAGAVALGAYLLLRDSHEANYINPIRNDAVVQVEPGKTEDAARAQPTTSLPEITESSLEILEKPRLTDKSDLGGNILHDPAMFGDTFLLSARQHLEDLLDRCERWRDPAHIVKRKHNSSEYRNSVSYEFGNLDVEESQSFYGLDKGKPSTTHEIDLFDTRSEKKRTMRDHVKYSIRIGQDSISITLMGCQVKKETTHDYYMSILALPSFKQPAESVTKLWSQRDTIRPPDEPTEEDEQKLFHSIFKPARSYGIEELGPAYVEQVPAALMHKVKEKVVMDFEQFLRSLPPQ